MCHVGLQLYTVRDLCGENFEQTLRDVASLGYTTVEFAGLGEHSAEEVKCYLAATGLSAVSSHISIETIRREFPTVVRTAQTLGCKYITVPGPPVGIGKTAGEWRFFREELRFYAGQFAAAGLELCYHNHAREFDVLDEGFTPFAILFENAEPYFPQIDVYWAAFAGLKPDELILQCAGRCPMIHVKDMAHDSSRSDEIVGKGCLPWDKIVSAARHAGVRYYIVEQDKPRGSSLEAAATSLKNLKQFLG